MHIAPQLLGGPTARAGLASLAGLVLALAGCGTRPPAVEADRPEARAIQEACGGLDRLAKQACVQDALYERLEAAGVAGALETLESLAAVDEGVQRDGHVFVHGIGIRAYERNPVLEEVFPQCTEAFQSGCYHGVIQAHFTAEGAVDEEGVRGVCDRYTRADADQWIRFQCVHGLGHGLVMVHGHDLRPALRDCDLLTSGWDRRSCYGGAFMENIMHATAPHHPAEHLTSSGAAEADGGAGEGAAGHEHAGTAGTAEGRAVASPAGDTFPGEWQPLDPDDPLHPCSAVADRYKRSCYMMQTSAMLHLSGGDIPEAARTCAEAPRLWRSVCFQSLGRDISSYTLQDHDESIRLCDHAPERYRPNCYVGLVKHFVDLSARPEDGFAFCARLPEGVGRLRCLEAMGEQIGVLAIDSATRRELCEPAGTGVALDSCLYGARLIRRPPAALEGGGAGGAR